MQPQFLLVKLHRILGVAKEQAVFDQYDARGLQLQAGVFVEQLVWENQ